MYSTVSIRSVPLREPWRPATAQPHRYSKPQSSPRIGQMTGSISTNPLDTRVVSFVANMGATVIAFVAAPKFTPGFWRTASYVVGVVEGLRAMNDFFNVTGVGMKAPA